MVEALRALGVGIELEPGTGEYGDDIVVTPVWPLRGGTEVDCGQAGTVMRFVAAARRLRPRRRHARRRTRARCTARWAR